MLALCPEHPKRDQNPKFTPLSETTSIPVCFIYESPPRDDITEKGSHLCFYFLRGLRVDLKSRAILVPKLRVVSKLPSGRTTKIWQPMYVTRVRFQLKRFLAPKSSVQPTGTFDLKTRPFIQSANYCLVKMYWSIF